MLSHSNFYLREWQNGTSLSGWKPELPLTCSLWGQKRRKHICPASWGSIKFPVTLTVLQNLLPMWKSGSVSLDSLLPHLHTVALEQRKDKGHAEVQRPSHSPLLTLQHWQTERHETHAILQGSCSAVLCLTTKVVLIYHTNPRFIHGRHNQVCVSHCNTGGNERKKNEMTKAKLKTKQPCQYFLIHKVIHKQWIRRTQYWQQ